MLRVTLWVMSRHYQSAMYATSNLGNATGCVSAQGPNDLLSACRSQLSLSQVIQTLSAFWDAVWGKSEVEGFS